MNDNEQERYLIYNEDHKILVFIDDRRKNLLKIYIPGDYSILLEDIGMFVDKVFGDAKTDLVYLVEYTKKQKEAKCINNKLKFNDKNVIKKFYSLLYSFDEDTLAAIREYCIKYDMEPYFLSFEELNYLLNSIDEKVIGLDHISDAVTLLQKKLNYEEY